MNETGEPRRVDSRGRLAIAGATVVLLGAVIAVVLVASGDEEHQFTVAPANCVSDWNADAASLVLGQHQFDVHRYQKLEVQFLTPDGAALEATKATGGTCAVVFAAASIDAETSSTVQILRPIGWAPLSGAGAPRERLAELQNGAQADFNALLQPDGSIDPL